MISGSTGQFLTLFRPCRNANFKDTTEDATRRCETVLAKEGNLDFADAGSTFSCVGSQAIASCSELATLRATSLETLGSHQSPRFVGDYIMDQLTEMENG